MKLSLHGCRVSRAHFIKDGASLFPWNPGWLLVSHHSQVSHSGQYILWTPTLLVRAEKDLTGRSVWLIPKPGLSVIPGYLLEFQNYKFEKEGLFSVNIYSFNKHLLNTPYMMHTVLENVIKKWIGLIPSLFLTWFNEKTDHVWTLTIRVKVKVKSLNRVWLFVTPWTVAHHAWDSPGKNTWSGLPFPSPGDPPDPVIKPRSPAL